MAKCGERHGRRLFLPASLSQSETMPVVAVAAEPAEHGPGVPGSAASHLVQMRIGPAERPLDNTVHLVEEQV